MRFIPWTNLHLSQHALFRPIDCGGSFSFELDGESGAALVTRYPTYREDHQRRDRFKKYVKQHYGSWLAFARQKEYGDVRPVLVSGFDMTKDFAMAAYSNVGTSLKSDLKIGVPMVASGSAAFWGKWYTRHSPHTNYGPQECIPPERVIAPSLRLEGTPECLNEYNQCVFIRYYTMRMRLKFFPQVIQAAAGPHDLGPGDNTGGAFPDLVVQSNAESTPSDDEPGEDGEGVVIHNTPSVRCLPSALFPL